MVLLDRINSPFVRSNASVLQALMRLIPFLAFGEQTKMQTLVNHFQPYLDFNRFDLEHNHDEQIHIDCFCVIANGIEVRHSGRTFLPDQALIFIGNWNVFIFGSPQTNLGVPTFIHVQHTIIWFPNHSLEVLHTLSTVAPHHGLPVRSEQLRSAHDLSLRLVS